MLFLRHLSRVLMITLIFSGISHAANSPTSDPVKWEDVKSWKSFGTRWVAGLNDSKQIIAIYDLSYPDFFRKIRLGNVGAKKLDLKEMIELIKKGKSENQINALEEVEPEEIEQATRGLSEAVGDDSASGLFPKNWWKKLPWKSNRILKSRIAPVQFNLAEIDFASISSDPKKFESQLNEAVEAASTADDQPLLGKDFLRQFEFIKQPDGGYDLYWTPTIRVSETVSKPKKMVDLMDIKDGMKRALAWDLLQTLINEAIGQITVPIASSIFNTASNRFFHFQNLLIRAHQYMILEMLSNAEEESAFSPFNALTVEERSLAAQSLVLAQTSLRDAWKWHFKDPAKEWNKEMNRDSYLAEKSMGWLGEQSSLPLRLNSHFAMTNDPVGTEKIFLLSYPVARKESAPMVAISHLDPEKIRQERIAVEITATAIHFGSHFVPLAGSVIRKVYNYFVEGPVNMAKRWEARLTTHLEERIYSGAESWEADLKLLDGQRINPFEYTRDEMNELISERRKGME